MRGGSGRSSSRDVEDGPVLRAHIKRDEVLCSVVTWATTYGDGCMSGGAGWGEVASAGPPGGCFPYTEDLIYLRLME